MVDSAPCTVKVLGLELRSRDGVLRFYDPTAECYLLSYSESEQARHKAEQRAESETIARTVAEKRILALEAQLGNLQQQ